MKASESRLKGQYHCRDQKPHACESCPLYISKTLDLTLKIFKHVNTLIRQDAEQRFQPSDYSKDLHLFFYRVSVIHFSSGERYFQLGYDEVFWRSHILPRLGFIWEYFTHVCTLLRQHVPRSRLLHCSYHWYMSTSFLLNALYDHETISLLCASWDNMWWFKIAGSKVSLTTGVKVKGPSHISLSLGSVFKKL